MSRRNTTFWSKVGETGVGKMEVGQLTGTNLAYTPAVATAGSILLSEGCIFRPQGVY